MKRRELLPLTAILVMVVPVGRAAAQSPVEPLLQKYCLGCHNQNDKEAGLSLQTPDDLKKGGDNGAVLNLSLIHISEPTRPY